MRHVESHIQRNCVSWFRLAYRDLSRCIFAIPNGMRTSATQGRILKAEGMLAGVSDLILMVPCKGYHALCVELKTEKGRQSDSQKAFQKAVEAQGYKYIIVRSFDDFRKQVTEYLNYEQKGNEVVLL